MLEIKFGLVRLLRVKSGVKFDGRSAAPCFAVAEVCSTFLCQITSPARWATCSRGLQASSSEATT